MNSKQVQESLRKFSEVTSFNYPGVGWYFSSEEIEDSFVFRKTKWVCMFMYMKLVMNKGKRIRFSGDNERACDGAASYFGYAKIDDNVGVFLTETEHVYKNIKIANAYIRETEDRIHPPKGKYLYMEKLENIDSNREVEVVNLFPAKTSSLLNLVTLSSYDRITNDNTITPSSSACQGFFTIPYNEQFKEHPKSVIGLFDIVAMKFLPEDMIAFSNLPIDSLKWRAILRAAFLIKD